MRRALVFAALFLAAGGAAAQTGSPSQCGPVSVGTSAVSITFPAAGAHGPPLPTLYLSIGNPSASASLWVNAFGGTAAPNAAGSFLIGPGSAPLAWSAGGGIPPPATVSIIATAAGTPVTCAYQ